MTEPTVLKFGVRLSQDTRNFDFRYMHVLLVLGNSIVKHDYGSYRAEHYCTRLSIAKERQRGERERREEREKERERKEEREVK